ncbi:MAG: AAA family ATPase [Planctomycetota bacterium]|nr:AAA family ATPase [Planctomycetota bacterium]
MDDTTKTIERLPKPEQPEAERSKRLAEIRHSLVLIFRPNDVIEVRVLGIPSNNDKFPPHNASGYFDDLDKAAAAILKYDERGANVYVTINPTIPDLLARASNKIVERAKGTTGDVEILTRRWLPIDIDPHRPSGIAANTAERDSAHALSVRVDTLLRSQGWGHPLLVDSGNGRYLLYRIDQPNDALTTALLKAFYPALALALGEPDKTKPYSEIDTGVFNAARIFRPGGATNRKGDGTPDRPHRRCVYLAPVPGCPVDVVPVEVIREFVATYGQQTPPVASTTRSPGANGSGHRLDLPRYLGARGVTFKAKPVDGGTMYVVPCPFNASHGAHGESAAYQAASGLTTFECKHNSCQGRKWEHYRDAIGEPDDDHYDPPMHSGNGQAHTSAKAEPVSKDPAPLAFTQLMSFVELLALDTRVEYLVDDVLVRGQPGVVGGRSKTLKTSVIIDLVLSLGSGTPFLGKWPTRRCNVAFWSGESGAATIKAKAIAAAVARGVDAAEVHWSFDLPKLCRDDHLAAMGEVITQRGIEVAVIDPLYLTLLDARTAGQASNVFAMGPALAPLTALGQETGCTILLAHHFRKTGSSDPDEPASLEQLSQAGVAEWVRQWLLLERRSPYQADGRHELYLRTGGSAGHAGLWALDVDEGIRTEDHQHDWRRWDVEVRPIGDVRAELQQAKESRKADALGERDAVDRRKMLEALRRCPDGDTKHVLRELTGLSADRASTALRQLIGEGRAEMFTQRKHTRDEAYYRIIET